MSQTLDRVRRLVARGEFLVSDHGFEELSADDIVPKEAAAGVAAAMVVEDYPQAFKGPSVLALQQDGEGRPIHVLWGIPREQAGPAVLVTAYRPDLARWTPDFLRRRTS